MSKDSEKQVINELKKSNKVSRIAIGAAFVFVGLQMWPATSNYGMKLAMGAIFIITGFWIAFLAPGGSKKSRINKVMRWVSTAIGAIGILAAIGLYIVAWINME